mmetsp:Transcript_27682/g.41488  ORF Transcript_27682/g.41488 Transcript_27682/m.41488 type:complete len:90 (-) Transcript_27682:8-277(-)
MPRPIPRLAPVTTATRLLLELVVVIVMADDTTHEENVGSTTASHFSDTVFIFINSCTNYTRFTDVLCVCGKGGVDGRYLQFNDTHTHAI